MKKALPRLIRPARNALWLTVIIGAALAVVTMAQMTWLSAVVSRVFLSHANLAQVMPILLFLSSAMVVRALLTYWREVVAQRGARRAKSALRERLFAHLLRLGPAYCKDESTGELVATASEGIERLDAYIGRYLPQVYLSVLVPLLIALYIVPHDWISALLLLFTGPIIPLLTILVGSYAEKRIQSQWNALARMSSHFLDVIQGLTTLKLF
ncbi:MAG: thiol reductant ABC exporter subunit CydD, partial [Ktedonobacteraceae bacterium]|nr:thiol reductant ABC exporter subunit CydD [Ktedonobacteraceae bacterium]